MTLPLRSAGVSDVGRKRKHNEDAYHISDELGLFVVADGMGGHAAGEVASAEAIDQIIGMVRRGYSVVEQLSTAANVDEGRLAVRRMLESAVQAATYMIFGIAEQSPKQKGMGTTISTLLLTPTRAFIAQVGDSRVYRYRDARVEQLTEDHTLVQEQVKLGLITEEEARTSKMGNMITRAVGIHDYVQVDTFDFSLEANDRFMLCSDGLCGYLVTPDELLPHFSQDDLQLGAQGMIDFANERGGKDNITAIVVEWLGQAQKKSGSNLFSWFRKNKAEQP
jgi:protein phosphatase